MSTGWTGGGEPGEPPVGEPGRRPRTRRLGLTALGFVLVVTAGAIFAVSRRDDGGNSAGPPPTTTESARAAEELTGATEFGTGLPDRATNVSAPPDVADTVDAPASEPAPPSAASSTVADVVEASSAPVLFVVELAPELADIAPTEVVALDFQESIVEVSIPSGRVRVTDIGFSTNGTRLVTTDFGALVWPMPGGAYELLSANGERAFVEGAPPVAVAATPGLDRFYVWHSDGDDTPVWVAANGDQGAGQPARANLSDVLVDPFGALLDSGGGERGPPDGAGTGLPNSADVVATGRNHVLLRECDVDGACRLASLDRNGFRTIFPTDLPDDANPLRIDGLSPSGDALLMAAVRKSNVDNPPALEVLELVDGSRRILRARPDAPARAAWATDSTGVFFADVQLYFVDRTTGEAIVVSPELPKLRHPTTRVPGQTSPCELLGVVMPIFDEMRAAEGDPVRPPPPELLLDVIGAQPTDVARETRSLVNFLTSFVSIEQPESQRPANWPSDVRAGLDALDAAVAVC